MSWRTVIIETRCKLDYRMGYMVVRASEVQRIFLDEIAVLVIENPAVSFTGCLMEALVEKKIRVIFCDSKRNPMAELTPHHGCHDSTARIKAQIQWKDDTRGAVWRAIIREKIVKQADLLDALGKNRECELLRGYIRHVELGDATNREGHAAKVYFNALFGMGFTRNSDVPLNAALNYGYSLLLSAFNREICALGCLTQLGIFHDNRFNHFNLGCDLMEPFRIVLFHRGLKLACVTHTSGKSGARAPLARSFSSTLTVQSPTLYNGDGTRYVILGMLSMRAFCQRKYNSDFAREMSRSVAEYMKQY